MGCSWYRRTYLIIDLDIVALASCFIHGVLVIIALGVIFDIQSVQQGGMVQDDPRGEVLWKNGGESAISPKVDQTKGVWGCRSGKRAREHHRSGSQLPGVVLEVQVMALERWELQHLHCRPLG